LAVPPYRGQQDACFEPKYICPYTKHSGPYAKTKDETKYQTLHATSLTGGDLKGPQEPPNDAVRGAQNRAHAESSQGTPVENVKTMDGTLIIPNKQICRFRHTTNSDF
jgi:hypothetical protein